MKVLLDTCVWIEWFTDSELADNFIQYFEHLEQIVVPVIIQYELYKWVCRERDEATALEIIAITQQCCVISVDTSLALQAADYAKQYGLAMADAFIYTTAQQENSTLITIDKHFENLPNAFYLPKSGFN